MRILGINDSHNASACLVADGCLIAAIQEERLRRIKNWTGFPEHAVRWILEQTGLHPSQIDLVAFNGLTVAPLTFLRNLAWAHRLANYPLVPWLWQYSHIAEIYSHVSRPIQQRRRLKNLAALGIPAQRAIFVEHHLAHAASAYFGWGQTGLPVLVLTADGSGDGLCATVNLGQRGELTRLAAVDSSASLGGLYGLVTLLLGMTPCEHEHKVMGLAPYAPSKLALAVAEKLRQQFTFDGADGSTWRRTRGCPDMRVSYPFLKRLLEEQRFDVVAGGVQSFLEDWLCDWVRHCVQATGVRRLALAGGVFMNVKANQAIAALPCVDEMFVFPSCGDETGAIGAAWWAHFRTRGSLPGALEHLYLGPEYTDQQIRAALEGVARPSWSWERSDDPELRVARLLARGEIVARFQGRMEFGARALGNRSILAHPSRPELVRILNESIKQRDFWMPFAPTILDRRAQDYLVNPKSLSAPYMILAFNTTNRRDEISAAIHPWDGTARPQIVTQPQNPSFYSLLSKFASITGCGAVLNTSFNLHGEPIVMSPQDALDVFARSGLKHLVMGHYLIQKKSTCVDSVH